MSRFLVLTLVVAGAVGCSSKKKHEKSRFIVEIEAEEGQLQVEVAGHPIPLTRPDPVSGMPQPLRGMVDFKESEVPAKTPFDVKVMTPCGEKKLELSERLRRPPNESNVAELRLTKLDIDELVHRSTVLFAPSIKGPVKLGDMTVPEPVPRTLTVFDLGCGKPITVASESAPVPAQDRIVVVAPSATACLRLGEALYGEGGGCRAPWSRDYTGFLVYPLDAVPLFVFEPPDPSVMASKQQGCANATWLQECSG
jgi:hypothetical protein